MSIEKVKVTATFTSGWTDGNDIAQVIVRVVQGGNEIANQTVPYSGGDLVVNFGGEVPNGDTTFIAQGLDVNGAPLGEPREVFFRVDKHPTPMLDTITAA